MGFADVLGSAEAADKYGRLLRETRLKSLREAREYRDESALYFAELCLKARQAGHTWGEIGKAAGIDRAAAMRLVRRAQAREDHAKATLQAR